MHRHDPALDRRGDHGRNVLQTLMMIFRMTWVALHGYAADRLECLSLLP